MKQFPSRTAQPSLSWSLSSFQHTNNTSDHPSNHTHHHHHHYRHSNNSSNHGLLPSSASSLLNGNSITETLDDLELSLRVGHSSFRTYLSSFQILSKVSYALIQIIRTLSSRKQLLRACWLFHQVVQQTTATDTNNANKNIQAIFHGIKHVNNGLLPFIHMMSEKISDQELCQIASKPICVLLGWKGLEEEEEKQFEQEHNRDKDKEEPLSSPSPSIWINDCVKILMDLLITEISLTNRIWALDALGWLLRRDQTRIVFCQRDGLTTLVERLKHNNMREKERSDKQDNCDEIYKILFAIWMLSFAQSNHAITLVLTCSFSSRLSYILMHLLNDDQIKQKLKITRVILAILKNLSVHPRDDPHHHRISSSPPSSAPSSASSSSTLSNLSIHHHHHQNLHTRFRQELVTIGVPHLLNRIFSLVGSSLWSIDIEAHLDVEYLKKILTQEEQSMTTFDKYITEIQSGQLKWSTMHNNHLFFITNAEKFITTYRNLITILADFINPKRENISNQIRIIACNDLIYIMSTGPIARSICKKLPFLKSNLFQLMTTADDPHVRQSALRCAQKLLMKNPQ